MKATDLLEKQHREVEQLFEQLEKGEGPTQQLVFELADNLAAHAIIEEKLFYPEIKRAFADAQDVEDDDGAQNEGIEHILEAFEEHAIVKVSLARLVQTGIDEEPFKARVTALKELVAHHVEEEENDLFPDVEDVLEQEDLRTLGLEMKELFDASMERGHASILAEEMGVGTVEDNNEKALHSERRGVDGRARHQAR